MKYIDAEKLKAEIERRIKEVAHDKYISADSKTARIAELRCIDRLIDSLQQPEDVVLTANVLLEALSKTPYNNKPITADYLLQVRKKLKEYYPKLSLLCTPTTSTNLAEKEVTNES